LSFSAALTSKGSLSLLSFVNMAALEFGEQEALERLKARLYPDGQEKAREGKTGQGLKVKLNDLADFLAKHPGCKIPKGQSMACAKCGQRFKGGEFRVCYQAGWFCQYCYRRLSLAALGVRCVRCKEIITIDDWRYKLHSATSDGSDLTCWFVHQRCIKQVERLDKAA